jgi:hypothetical protein
MVANFTSPILKQEQPIRVEKSGWGDNYITHRKPSAFAIKAESDFKDLTSKFLKCPKWANHHPNFFWNKINDIQDEVLREQYFYILDAVTYGMGQSHPDVNLRDCSLLELCDFVLGVDHSIRYKSWNLGVDVTTNPNAPNVKEHKVHHAYRGAKLDMIKEFYDGYIIILWSVKDYENANHESLKSQLLKGLSEWRPKEFTHIIELK